ncbi:MAG: TMEM175 family protein [Chloroflexi bacterium]|nr:TMEM175 family protein [Chloroflexota bacterium]
MKTKRKDASSFKSTQNASDGIEAVNNQIGLERIVFFSDAVMAIAITLLAIDLKLPELNGTLTASDLANLLNNLGPRLMSFVISFAVVGIYWVSHHRYFGLIQRYDGVLMVLNLLFLLFIVLMPFVANLFGHYGYLPLAISSYAIAVAAIGLVMSAIWLYASHNHRLVDKNLAAEFIRTRNIVALVVPVIFLISIPFAWLNPFAAMFIWWISPLVSLIVVRTADRWIKPKRHPKLSNYPSS